MRVLTRLSLSFAYQWECAVLQRLVQIEVVVPDQQHVNHECGKVDPSQDEEDLTREERRQQGCVTCTHNRETVLEQPANVRTFMPRIHSAIPVTLPAEGKRACNTFAVTF